MSELNSDQKRAVYHDKGPIIVIAGAGTGKTKVITERIVYLIKKKKVKAEEILAVTFTEKAAGEMLERIDQRLPYGYGDLWVLTFHGLCDRILRESSLHIGINPGYELMGYPEQIAFLRKNLFKSFNLKYFRPLNNPYKFIDALIKHVSRLQDEDVSYEEYKAYAFSKLKGKSKKALGRSKNSEIEAEAMDAERLVELAAFYEKYQKLKLENNRLDFGDLLFYTLELFRKRPNILKNYQDRFRYVLVDEFQDTNYIQNEIAVLLAAPENNIMVVGDDDQAIYRFRGASISNILQFQERFPNAEVITLTKNYRSVQEILDEAGKVIVNNNPYRLEVKAGVSKKLVAQSSKSEAKDTHRSKLATGYAGTVALFGEKEEDKEQAIEVARFQREFDEADFIAQRIMEITGYGKQVCKKEKGDKISFEDIAILVRAHSYLTPIVQRLRFYGIPYQFSGTTDLFNRPVVKDVMALLRLLKDLTDDISAYRVFTFGCFGISPEGLMTLISNASYLGKPLYEYVKDVICKRYNVTRNDTCSSVVSKIGKYASRKGEARLRKFFNYVDKTRERIVSFKSISVELFNLLKQIDFIEFLEREIPSSGVLSGSGPEAVATLYEFLSMLQRFEGEGPFSLPELIEYLENLESLGGIEQRDVDVLPLNGVQLMTVHGAKGLEFEVVIMPCLVKDRFPSRGQPDLIPIPDEVVKEILPEGDEKIQEERRLFYVGMTRAKKKVILTFSDYYADGKQLKQPSLFLYELLGEKVRELPYGKVADSLEQEPEIKVARSTLGGDREEERLVGVRPTAVSFSQLSEYKKCPKQYYFKYVLKLKAPPSAVLSFGNTIHTTLKKFFDLQRRYILSRMAAHERFVESNFNSDFKREKNPSFTTESDKIEKQEVHKLQDSKSGEKEAKDTVISRKASREESFKVSSQKTLVELISSDGVDEGAVPPTLDDLLRLYEESWINSGYRNRKYEEKRKKSGREALEKFYHTLYSRDDFPVKLEESFRAKVGDITVLGKIDRIDMLDEKGKEVKLVDYKTGTSKGKIEPEEKIQLIIYALAVKERFKWIPKKLSIIRVEDSKEQSIEWNDELLDKARDFVLNTVEEIEKKGFPARPGFQCQYCDYRNICNWAKR